MNRGEALAITRSASRHGAEIDPQKLQEAIRALRQGYDRKRRLPALPEEYREHMNAVLCFNLGRAIGRAA